MPATLWRRFRRRFVDDTNADTESGGDTDANEVTEADERDTDESSDTNDDESRFVPSPLDMSVRHAHGSNEAAVDRELQRIQQQAEEIERRRRD